MSISLSWTRGGIGTGSRRLRVVVRGRRNRVDPPESVSVVPARLLGRAAGLGSEDGFEAGFAVVFLAGRPRPDPVGGAGFVATSSVPAGSPVLFGFAAGLRRGRRPPGRGPGSPS